MSEGEIIRSETNQGKWQATLNGGVEPRWTADGRELFYIATDGTLMSVPFDGKGSSPFFGKHEALLKTGLVVSALPSARRYDVAPDGKRFLINSPGAPRRQQPNATEANPITGTITAVLNWTAPLRNK